VSNGNQLETLGSLLMRPVLFSEVQRAVWPPSWLGHTAFAMWLVDVCQPRVLVELGTHSGNSFAAFCQGVEACKLSTKCFAVDTWKGDPHSGAYEESVFSELSDYVGTRYSGFAQLLRTTFEDAINEFTDGSVDLLNIDGYHTYEATKANFDAWLPKMSQRGVVLIHDVNVRRDDFGAYRFWEEIESRFPSFTFLHSHGLGVAAVGTEIPPEIRLLTSARALGTERFAQDFFARLGEGPTQRAFARYYSAPSGKHGADSNSNSPAELSEKLAREISARVALDATLRQQARKIHELLTSIESQASLSEDALAWKRLAQLHFGTLLGVCGQQFFDEDQKPITAEEWIKQQDLVDLEYISERVGFSVSDYKSCRDLSVALTPKLGKTVPQAVHQVEVLESYVTAMRSPGHRFVSACGRIVRGNFAWRLARKARNLFRVAQQA
jgi:hypothetical protein